MAKKRYSRSESEVLLARLVAFAEGGEEASTTEGRQVLAALLSAPLGDTVIGPHAREDLRHWTDSQVRSRQRGLAYFLTIFVLPIAFDVTIKELRLGAQRLGPGVALRVDGAAADVITFQTISLLRAAGVERLQRCECGKVYSRIGRQEYCSITCQKRYYMRSYRESAVRPQKRGRGYGKTTRPR